MNVVPPQSGQLANPQTRVDRHIDHRRVRLWDQLYQLLKLLNRELGLVSPFASSFRWHSHVFDRVSHQKLVLDGGGQHAG